MLLKVLVLVFVMYSRRHRTESYAAGVDPNDDVRENIIHYDEEGVGKRRNPFKIIFRSLLLNLTFLHLNPVGQGSSSLGRTNAILNVPSKYQTVKHQNGKQR